MGFRRAMRSFVKMPGWVLGVLATLAIGFACNAVVVSIAYAVLMKPLPYASPERLVTVWEVSPEGHRTPISPARYLNLKTRCTAFSGTAAYFVHSSGGQALGTGEGSEWVTTASVTPDLFGLLGIAPIRGALFGADAESGVVLGHAFWTRRFGAAPDIVGTALIIGGRAQPVIGVLPPGLEFPVKADVYAPLVSPGKVHAREAATRYLGVVARLRNGVTRADALGEISRLSDELAAEMPDVFRGWRVTLLGLRESSAEGVRPTVLALLGASLLVLLMACVNVATLTLAKGLERGREFAVYAALGASPGRLAAQLLVESCALSFVAAAAGLLSARWTLGVLRIALEGQVPRVSEAVVNAWVGVSVSAAALMAGLVAGAPLVLLTRRLGLVSILHGQASAFDLRGLKVLRSGLVGTQVALLVPLLVGTGLLTRTLVRLGRIQPGFSTEGLVTVQLRPPPYKYDRARLRHLGPTLVERFNTLPGVTGAAVGTDAPLSGGRFSMFVVSANTAQKRRAAASIQSVSERYLNVMGIPLLRGRQFEALDSSSREPVAIVSPALADQLWPDEQPVGKRLIIEPDPASRLVVGIAGDTRAAGLDQPPVAEVYVPFDQFPLSFLTAVIRVGARGSLSTGNVVAAVRMVDKELAVARVASVEQLLVESTAAYRQRTFLVGGAGSLAALLAGIGIYSLVSFVVHQQRREWAVRMVVGATPVEVVWAAIGKALKPVILGAVVGVLGALVLSRVIRALLFEVAPTDATTYATSILLVALLALLAAYAPARRAAATDITESVRAE